MGKGLRCPVRQQRRRKPSGARGMQMHPEQQQTNFPGTSGPPRSKETTRQKKGPEGSSVPGDRLLPQPSPPPPKPVDAHPGERNPPAIPVPRPALRLCHARLCCITGKPLCREIPTQANWRDPSPQFPGTPLLLCASNAAQTFWGEGAGGNPSRRHSHVDGTQFLITQRVVAMPQSCQRCQQQQPRL